MIENSITIPDGAICLTASLVKKKLACGNTWLWERVKNDPDFPKPVYLGPHRPMWIEQQLDDFLRRKAAESQHV